MSLYEYTPVPATTTMRSVPRFGHSNDFSSVFSAQEQRNDYLWGLLFCGIFVLAFFVAWTLLLLVLKCLGQRRVGFLSGAAMTTTTKRRPFYVRLVWVNACILFIVFTVLVVTQGITNLHSAVSVVDESNEEVQSLLRDARGISLSLQSIGSSSVAVRDELTQEIQNGICPNEPNIETLTGIDFQELAENAISLLNELGDFIEQNVGDLRLAIDDALEASRVVETTVDEVQYRERWQSLVILVPNLTLACLLWIGVLLAWFRKSNTVYTSILQWVVLPLFVICVIVAYCGSAFTAFAAVANADACSGGADQTPDGTVFAVLEQQELDPQSYVYLAVQYYVSQCAMGDFPFDFIRAYQEEIESASTTLDDLLTSVDAVSIDRLNLICGKDFGPFESLLKTMATNLDILGDNAQDTLELLQCDRIVPIYVNSVYGATCTYSVTGVTWTWAAFLVVAFMGMLMITFRSAYLPNAQDDIESDSSSDKNYLPHQSTYPPSNTSSPVNFPPDDEDVPFDDDMSSMSSVYIDQSFNVSFDENSQAPPSALDQ